MAFCLNPDCPHKKKIGRPAEFREGFTHCSDCGGPLSEGVIESKEVIEKEDIQKAPRRIIPTHLKKRILYTVGFVLLYRVLLLIPVPGLDPGVLKGVFHIETQGLMRLFGYAHTFERVSVFALGFLPYFNAYIFVEILSLFIQPLKSWREEGYPGRMKLREVALFTTFLFAFLHGYALAQGFEGMLAGGGEKVVRNPGLSFRLISALTLTAGTFLTIWIAERITKKGIGHGISLLILAGFGQDIVSGLPRILLLYYQGSPLGHFLLIAAMIVGIMAVVLFMEKGYKRISVKYRDGIETYIPLKFTSAGIMPVYWGSMLIGLAITILGFINNPTFQKIYVALFPGHIGYYVTFIIILFFLYYFFTSFFHNPKNMVTLLRNKNASILFPLGKDEESYMDRSLESMIPIAAVYLCVVRFLPNAIFYFFIDFHLDSIGLIVAVAILLDLIEEIRLRRGGHLAKIAELHDVPSAGLVKSLFEQKGLPCYLRGYYHRALLYFFGPYIEISVLVPEDRVGDAREVIENYFDAKVLTVRPPHPSPLPAGEREKGSIIELLE